MEDPTMLDRIVAFKVSETTSSHEMSQLEEAVGRAAMGWERIRVYLEVDGFRHMDPEALLEKLNFLRPHRARIERMAMVCRRVWIKAWVEAGGFVVPGLLKVFDASEEKEAWKWIRS